MRRVALAVYELDETYRAPIILKFYEDLDAPEIAARLGIAPSTVTGKVEAYDPSSNSWSSKAPMPTARHSAAAAVVGTKIYVCGGDTLDTNVATVEVYDTVTDSWSSAAPMSTVRDDARAVSLDGIVYVLGGYPESDGATDTVEAYDPVANAWTASASMPVPRADFGIGVIRGEIYAVGGRADLRTGGPLSTMDVYDPATNTWRSGMSMPTARAAVGAAVVGQGLYVAGGFDGVDGSAVYATLEVLEDAIPPSLQVPPDVTVECTSEVGQAIDIGTATPQRQDSCRIPARGGHRGGRA